MVTPKLSVTAAVLFIVFGLESLFPHFKGRRSRIMHGLPHGVVAVFNGFITSLALVGLTHAVTTWSVSGGYGILNVFPLPPFLGGVAAFLLFDIWMYFWHMANHRIAFLWLFHRAHHSDTAMDTTTALRFHPGELVLSTFARLPVLVLIGMSFNQLVLYEITLNISTLFHHSNIGIPEKWDRILRALIVTPNMHRVHHSIERFETNSNFTSTLSVWDRLNRTFRKREDTLTITIGLPVLREMKWQRLGGFLITPFVRVE